MGVAYETMKSRLGVASMGVLQLELVMKSMVFVVSSWNLWIDCWEKCLDSALEEV